MSSFFGDRNSVLLVWWDGIDIVEVVAGHGADWYYHLDAGLGTDELIAYLKKTGVPAGLWRVELSICYLADDCIYQWGHAPISEVEREYIRENGGDTKAIVYAWAEQRNPWRCIVCGTDFESHGDDCREVE